MSYLLDTNVISETIKHSPNQSVLDWFKATPSDSLYISVITIGEIRKSIEKLTKSNKKERLLSWLEHDLSEWFENKILPIDFNVADRWGYVNGTLPRSLPAIDTLIASTALVHNLKLVTRNVSDFQIPGLEIINPWHFND